jgi:hypothetical protein
MARDLLLGRSRRDWSIGSIVLPAKQQKAIFDKIDEVRYDVRTAANNAKLGMLALTAAVGFVGAVSLYRMVRK